MTRTSQILLVRHGETSWSRQGRHTGRTDIPLDPAGEEQARLLRAPLQSRTYAAVYVSPLERARRTCELAGYLDVATIDDDLQEWSYGAYEGLTGEEIQAQRAGWSIWKHGVVAGETIEQVAARADRVIVRIRDVDGDVLLFAHGHLLRVLAARWCGLSPLAAEHLALSAAAISVIGHDRESPVIWRWNDTAHLGDSLPAGR